MIVYHLICPQSRLEPPVDKTLMAVKSLTLDTRGITVPRKNQVKMISSCPLPYAGPDLSPGPSAAPGPSTSPGPEQMYSQITVPAAAVRGARMGKRGSDVAPTCASPLIPQEPEYSLPFDTIASNVMANLLKSHQAHAESGADPLYDSIDEMKIRNIFHSDPVGLTYGKVEHIYDEPEGCAAVATATANQEPPTSVYDDPEEMRGDAWKIMGTTTDPKGHEYPYNPKADDYAVPKRPQRLLTQSTNEEERGGAEEPQENEEEPREELSPYNNVMVKMK